MFVIVETVPQTGEKRSFRSFGRFGLRHVRGTETLLEPVLQRQTVFLKQGLQKRKRCQLHRVYNRPDGKQASFYFYLIQHRDNERGAVTTTSNPQQIKILQENGRTASVAEISAASYDVSSLIISLLLYI